MAARYFAEIDDANAVLRVIVADDPEWPAETLGGTWVETKLGDNTVEYAGIGMRYASVTDKRFIRDWASIAFSTYDTDVWVWHDGQAWRSTIDNNSQTPGVGADWTTEPPVSNLPEGLVLINTTMASPASHLDLPSPYEPTDENTHPSVIDTTTELGSAWNGYRYWMAYTPLPGNIEEYENPCVCASNDGDTWVVPAGVPNPIAEHPGSGFNSDTDIVMDPDGTTMHLVYREYLGGSNDIDFVLISSDDGWDTQTEPTAILTVSSTAPLEVSPSLFYDEGLSKWVLYNVLDLWTVDGTLNTFVRYESATVDGTYSNRTLCTAPSSYDWGNLRGPWHSWIRPDDRVGGYISLNGCARASGDYAAFALTSVDGLVWYASDTPLQATTAELEDWDGFTSYRLSAAFTATGYDVWYSAKGTVEGDTSYASDNRHRIGRSSFDLPE